MVFKIQELFYNSFIGKQKCNKFIWLGYFCTMGPFKTYVRYEGGADGPQAYKSVQGEEGVFDDSTYDLQKLKTHVILYYPQNN